MHSEFDPTRVGKDASLGIILPSCTLFQLGEKDIHKVIYDD